MPDVTKSSLNFELICLIISNEESLYHEILEEWKLKFENAYVWWSVKKSEKCITHKCLERDIEQK